MLGMAISNGNLKFTIRFLLYFYSQLPFENGQTVEVLLILEPNWFGLQYISTGYYFCTRARYLEASET